MHNIIKSYMIIWLSLLLTVLGSELSASEPPTAKDLFDRYHLLKSQSHSQFDEPIALHSLDSDGTILAEVLSILDQPFSNVSEMLANIDNWCQFMPLNLNIKSCLHQQATSNNNGSLTLFLGKKTYQPPEDAFQLIYQYIVKETTNSNLNITMHAEEGPMGTSNYKINVMAVPLKGKTILRIQIAYTESWLSKLASAGYLATFGRNKVGFSILHNDQQGNPVYIKGSQAVIERNVMRYFFAVITHLETYQLSEKEGLEQRLRKWFSKTEQYSQQLHEMSWQEYRAIKEKEMVMQRQLQEQLGSR